MNLTKTYKILLFSLFALNLEVQARQLSDEEIRAEANTIEQQLDFLNEIIQQPHLNFALMDAVNQHCRDNFNRNMCLKKLHELMDAQERVLDQLPGNIEDAKSGLNEYRKHLAYDEETAN